MTTPEDSNTDGLQIMDVPGAQGAAVQEIADLPSKETPQQTTDDITMRLGEEALGICDLLDQKDVRIEMCRMGKRSKINEEIHRTANRLLIVLGEQPILLNGAPWREYVGMIGTSVHDACQKIAELAISGESIQQLVSEDELSEAMTSLQSALKKAEQHSLGILELIGEYSTGGQLLKQTSRGRNRYLSSLSKPSRSDGYIRQHVLQKIRELIGAQDINITVGAVYEYAIGLCRNGQENHTNLEDLMSYIGPNFNLQ